MSLQTTPCCWSHQYEAALTELGATLHDGSMTPVIADGKLGMVYDYDLKRTLVKNYWLRANATLNITIITHYDEGIQYILSFGTCFFRSVRQDAMQKPCIPEHFILESTLTLGSSTDGIPIQRWRGVLNGMTSVFTVDPSNCMPIFQSLYGTESSLDSKSKLVTLGGDLGNINNTNEIIGPL
ncbi:hypothetical protein CHS0354_020653 [Potamilus streckersoni]|uniref:Uncharacterized protein n=1 Tax=Potamilus streckersoni TaxID=2493646 RepID=A0AAE0T2K3_9BIVA|nr:hypothetical protein CHS0354_020653 [Potamilus streckersoni]